MIYVFYKAKLDSCAPGILGSVWPRGAQFDNVKCSVHRVPDLGLTVLTTGRLTFVDNAYGRQSLLFGPPRLQRSARLHDNVVPLLLQAIGNKLCGFHPNVFFFVLA